jgi:hypothetical protein
MPLGTSMDIETVENRSPHALEGFGDLVDIAEQLIASLTLAPTEKTPDFEPDSTFCDYLLGMGFGLDGFKENREYWEKHIKINYKGDDGRRRLRMALINLKDRDGLLGRVSDILCPVLWLQVSLALPDLLRA